jgi:hypothetical protein
MKTKYATLNKAEYVQARNLLIESDPKYGDDTNSFYIPPYIENIDCMDQERSQNRFCQEPEKFMDVCSIGLNVGDKDAYYANKLRICIRDQFGTVSSYETNFNAARNKLIQKDARYGDSNSQMYIPPYIPSIDCTQMENQFRFCQEPKKFMDGCATFVRQSDKDAYFLSKIQDCVLTHKGTINRNLESYRAARTYFAAKNPTAYATSRTAPLPLLRINTYKDFINKMNIKI